MDELKKVACEAIDREADHLHALSQEIWEFKELSYEEHKSHATLTQFLEAKGFKMERHFKLQTAFAARFEKLCQASNDKVEETHQKPHIAIICEYDALPEVGHACGHNLIAELGVAAGIGVKAAMEHSGLHLGKLSIIGTPGEEGKGGKIEMIKASAFDGVDVAMMSHPAPFTDARPVFLGTKRFKVNYHGRASHAAGFPWEGVNALDAAVLGYMNVSALRQQLHPSWRVHAIIVKGGTRTNIIPDETEMHVQIRAPQDSEVKQVEAKVKNCLRASAAATECTVDITDFPNPYECLVTNNTLATLYENNGAMIGIDFPTTLSKKVLGSTDMGNVSHLVPSLHPTYHCGTDAFNHTHEFATAARSESAQASTLLQGKALAMVALDLFQTPTLLQEIRRDFEEDLKNL